MLLLLALPVIIMTTACQRYLHRYAPSNRLIRRTRQSNRRLTAAGALMVLSFAMITAVHLLVLGIHDGLPEWLYLMALVGAWDAIKLGVAGAAMAVIAPIAWVINHAHRPPVKA